MQVIESTQYYDIISYDNGRIIEVKWKKNVLDMLVEDYKKVLKEAYTHLFDLKPEVLLQNTKDAVYPITPELQDWLTEEITKAIFEKVGLKKIAYLIPSDVLTKLGIEMLVDKAKQKSKGIPRRFFDDHSQALEWLKN